MVDDPLINQVLAKPDAFPHAEERRLFYVALTRARHGVFLLADKFAPSPFVSELEDDGYEVSYFGSTALVHQRCPTCAEGHLTLRQGKFGTFAGCSFYPLCDHTEAACPNCEAGLIRQQAGQFVCTNPDCEEVRETCSKCAEGWMVERQRKDGSGAFFACSRYPRCRHAKNVHEPNKEILIEQYQENGDLAVWGGEITDEGRAALEEHSNKSDVGATSYSRGDRVSHQTFGHGTVTHVDGNKLAVTFDKAGHKRVLHNFVSRS
jgi:ssDNA-binding Zn-finger/Zn-ribbon topoisomerase 1